MGPRPADAVPERVTLGRQLQVTAKVVGERFNRELDEVGLSRPLYLTLDQLALADGVRQCDLAARLQVESPTLTHHLDHLVQRGLVVRAPDPADRRVVRLALTPAGRRVHAAAAQVAGRLDHELQAALAPEELAMMLDLLTRVAARARRVLPRLATGAGGHRRPA
ncbi:MAG TPA: MarR family transcriptional regulator [Verrucomicrobiae bacterium]|nr:MarR family transcriptional regulator [Verrucomicrobiae bacterium]